MGTPGGSLLCYVGAKLSPAATRELGSRADNNKPTGHAGKHDSPAGPMRNDEIIMHRYTGRLNLTSSRLRWLINSAHKAQSGLYQRHAGVELSARRKPRFGELPIVDGVGTQRTILCTYVEMHHTFRLRPLEIACSLDCPYEIDIPFHDSSLRSSNGVVGKPPMGLSPKLEQWPHENTSQYP